MTFQLLNALLFNDGVSANVLFVLQVSERKLP